MPKKTGRVIPPERRPDKNSRPVTAPIEGYTLRYHYEDVEITSWDHIPEDARVGNRVILVQEPSNETDPEAVLLMLAPQKKRIGYLYRGELQAMANDYIDRGDKIVARLSHISFKPHKLVKIDIAFFQKNKVAPGSKPPVKQVAKLSPLHIVGWIFAALGLMMALGSIRYGSAALPSILLLLLSALLVSPLSEKLTPVGKMNRGVRLLLRFGGAFILFMFAFAFSPIRKEIREEVPVESPELRSSEAPAADAQTDDTAEAVLHRSGEAITGVSDRSLAADHIRPELSAVNGDVTGDWRLAVLSDPISVPEYALDYYHTYFQNDDEVHFIVIAGDQTSVITCLPGMLDVVVRAYMPGEEQDAALLGSGAKRCEYFVYTDNGDIELVQ